MYSTAVDAQAEGRYDQDIGTGRTFMEGTCFISCVNSKAVPQTSRSCVAKLPAPSGSPLPPSVFGVLGNCLTELLFPTLPSMFT